MAPFLRSCRCRPASGALRLAGTSSLAPARRDRVATRSSVEVVHVAVEARLQHLERLAAGGRLELLARLVEQRVDELLGLLELGLVAALELRGRDEGRGRRAEGRGRAWSRRAGVCRAAAARPQPAARRTRHRPTGTLINTD
eukprot:1393409-Prymnesium_polylepis.1